LSGNERHRVTPLIRKRHPIGPYSRTMPRALWKSYGEAAVSYERGTPVPPHRTALAEKGFRLFFIFYCWG